MLEYCRSHRPLLRSRLLRSGQSGQSGGGGGGRRVYEYECAYEQYESDYVGGAGDDVGVDQANVNVPATAAGAVEIEV